MPRKKTKEWEDEKESLEDDDSYINDYILRLSYDRWEARGFPTIKIQVGKSWASLYWHPQSNRPALAISIYEYNQKNKVSEYTRKAYKGRLAVRYAKELGLLL
jgi:hypothetical protein